MKYQKIIAAVLTVLLLSGCMSPEVDAPAASSISEEEASSQQSEIANNEEESASSSESVEESESADDDMQYHSTERDYRWSGDGQHLFTRQGNTIRFIGLDNEVAREVTFPYGADFMNTTYLYSWNDNRVLITCGGDTPGEETRIVARADGTLTLSNAAIYTMDGGLLREFPAPEQPLLEENLEPFERSVRQGVQNVTWLDDNHFAVNTKTRVYIYDLAEDRLRLVHDMIQAVRDGYSVYNANAYGAYENFWSWNGVYYYTACPEVPKDQKPQYNLYAADMENGSRLILSDVMDGELRIRDGKLISARYALTELPEDHAEDYIYDITLRLADLPGADLKETVYYQSMNIQPQWDGTYLIYDVMDYSTSPNRRIYHILDPKNGEETTFCPGDLDNMERSNGPYAYGLEAVLPGENGNRYLHSLYDTQEITENGESWLRGYTFHYLYDEETGENRLLKEAELSWADWSDSFINSARTHYVDGFVEVRVIPFD